MAKHHALQLNASGVGNGNGGPPSTDKLWKFCVTWNKNGSCRFGDKCTFKHGKEDKRKPPDNAVYIDRKNLEKGKGNGKGDGKSKSAAGPQGPKDCFF